MRLIYGRVVTGRIRKLCHPINYDDRKNLRPNQGLYRSRTGVVNSSSCSESMHCESITGMVSGINAKFMVLKPAVVTTGFG